MFTLSTKCYTFYPCKSIWASFLMLCYVSCLRLIEITKHNKTGFPPFLTLLIWTTAMFFFSAWKNELVSSKLRRRRIAYRCFQQGIPPSLAVDVSLSIDDNTYLLATASLTLSPSREDLCVQRPKKESWLLSTAGRTLYSFKMSTRKWIIWKMLIYMSQAFSSTWNAHSLAVRRWN